MNILLTGGAGFVGSHLADELLKLGNVVTAVDDFSCGKRENIAHLASNENFLFEEMDVLDRLTLRKVFERGKFHAVFHMVANSDIQAGARNVELDFRRTFESTWVVLNCMREFATPELVFASTSAVYGELSGPLREDSGPLFPISYYGAAKLAAEAYVSAWVANCNIKAWILRFPNVVGERTTHGVVFDFVNALSKDPLRLRILGDGTQCKPYLYVKDLVEGMLFVWQNSRDAINCFNLGVDSQTTVRRIAEIVVEELNLEGVAFDFTGGDRGWVGDVPIFQYDLNKVHQFGWRARRSSDDAIRLAVRSELARRRRPL